jgi:hypothetical protein
VSQLTSVTHWPMYNRHTVIWKAGKLPVHRFSYRDEM